MGLAEWVAYGVPGWLIKGGENESDSRTKESFYEVLYRLGPKLLSDEDFAYRYDLRMGRPSVPPSRVFKLVLLQAYEDLSNRKAIERMAFDLRRKAVLGLEVSQAGD